MKVSDLYKARPYKSIIAFGDSGTGKTSWAAKAPLPLFLLLEMQALGPINLVRPDAQVIPVKDLSELGRVWQQALLSEPVTLDNGQRASKLRYGGEEYIFQTLILDSFSKYNDWLLDSVCQTVLTPQEKAAGKASKSASSMTDEERMRAMELPVTQSRWLDVIRAMHRFCSDSTKVPGNVIFLAHAMVEKDGTRTVPETQPASVGAGLLRHFNAAGYLEPGNGGLRIQWGQAKWAVTKPGSPHWPNFIPNDFNRLERVSLGSLSLYDAMVSDSDSRSVPANESDSADVVGQIVDMLATAKTTKREVANDGL